MTAMVRAKDLFERLLDDDGAVFQDEEVQEVEKLLNCLYSALGPRAPYVVKFFDEGGY